MWVPCEERAVTSDGGFLDIANRHRSAALRTSWLASIDNSNLIKKPARSAFGLLSGVRCAVRQGGREGLSRITGCSRDCRWTSSKTKSHSPIAAMDHMAQRQVLFGLDM